MKTENDNYLIPIIIGVLAEEGIDVNDQILEKLITPQLIKIKNTFSNSPFQVLSPCSNDKERIMSKLTKERLEGDVVVVTGERDESVSSSNETEQNFKTIVLPKDSNSDKGMSACNFISSQSQILIALKSKEGGRSEVGKALEIREQGRLNELYQVRDTGKNSLYSQETGLTITINPETFDISSRITPLDNTPVETDIIPTLNTTFTEKVSFAFNSYIGSVRGAFDKFYGAYIESVVDGDKDRLTNSAFVEIVEKIDGYNKDITGYLESKGTEQAVKSRAYLLSDEADNTLISNDKALDRAVYPYSGADVLSQFYQRRTNRYINWIYILFFAAVLLYGIIDLNYYLVLCYIALIPAIGFLVYRSKAEKIEDRFLDYRALAEGLRVMVFWRIAGINEKVSSNYQSKYSGLVSWISRGIKSIEVSSMAEDSGASKMDSKSGKKRMEITNKLWIDSQLEYFGRKRNPLYMRSLDLGNLALVSFMLTLFFALIFGIYLLFAGLGNDGAITNFEVLIGAVAAIGVAAQAYKSKKAYDELERRYTLTRHIYATASKKLKSNPSMPEGILIAVGKEALLENSDWLWTHRNLPIELPKG